MFVTLEGIDGSGKTTLQQSLALRLKASGREVLTTREPGAGELGRAIRQWLLEFEHLAEPTEVFLFLADRSQHVAQLIRPALKAGAVVLCDRFADSTVVYQGHGRGHDLSRLREWNAFATQGLAPDLTLLLDLPAADGQRRQSRADRIERSDPDFFARLRDGYLAEANLDPERWVVLDATAPAQAVAEAAWSVLSSRLGNL